MENPKEAVDLGQVADYKTGNYLFDEVLYQRLHRLAISQRLISLEINLANKDHLEKLIQKVEQETIGVLDLNNLVLKGLCGRKNIQRDHRAPSSSGKEEFYCTHDAQR